MSKVAVLGTTSWGTTLAVLLARNGVDVALVCRSESEVRNMLASGENRRHRPGLLFPELPFRTLLVWRHWREPVRRADLSVRLALL